MAHFTLSTLVVAMLLLVHQTRAQQSCINTCTDSANVLTQLKTCSGCGTDDWPCFCRCNQYMDALLSCAKQYCSGTNVTDSIVSFCADQGVTLPYSSTSSSPSSSSTTSTTSGAALGASSSTTATSSSTSFTATDSSDISAYLALAVPSTARTESSSACFVNTKYSYYSTPTWYTSLPTQVQSYYSSVNQGNTAACTLSPTQAAAVAGSKHGGSGLSGGAIAGIVIGALLAALLLALLLWLCLRRRRRARREAAANRSRNMEPRNLSHTQMGSQAPYWSEKGYPNGAAAPNSTFVAPIGGGRAPGSTNMAPVVGAAALAGNDDKNHPYTHTTTTTTRTIIRPRPKNPPYRTPSNQSPIQPPQPTPIQAPINNNNSPQNIPRKPTARRVF